MLRLAPFTGREIRTAVNATVRLIEPAPTKVPPRASSRLPESSKERSVAQGFSISRLTGLNRFMVGDSPPPAIPLWGFLVFLLYTMRRVNCRRCGIGCRRSSLGRRQTHTDQSLHALLSPLDAETVMERDGGGLSHLLGQGLRRGGTRRYLRARAPGARPIDAIGVDEIQYAKVLDMRKSYGSAPSAASNLRSITHLASCPSRNHPRILLTNPNSRVLTGSARELRSACAPHPASRPA